VVARNGFGLSEQGREGVTALEKEGRTENLFFCGMEECLIRRRGTHGNRRVRLDVLTRTCMEELQVRRHACGLILITYVCGGKIRNYGSKRTGGLER
jgi:hypothetical protein